MNKITINHGSFKLDDIELEHGTITIGRATDNDVQLDDSAVSSHHAKIVTFFNVSYIEDLDSTNGTIVNGRKVKKYTLHTGDIVLLGKHQVLFTGSKVAQDLGTSDSTVVMTKSDVSEALATAADANSRKNFPTGRPTPTEQGLGVQPRTIEPAPVLDKESYSTPASAKIPASRPSPVSRDSIARSTSQPQPTEKPAEADQITPFSAVEEDDTQHDDVLTEVAARRPSNLRPEPPAPPIQAEPPPVRPIPQAQARERDAVIDNEVNRSPSHFSNGGANRQPLAAKEQDDSSPYSPFSSDMDAANQEDIADAPQPPPQPPRRRKVLEDPSVSASEPGAMYHTPLDISETDRSAEYLDRAFGPQGGHHDIPAVGDKTLLRQIITGDRDFSPSRNKFEIVQIVLGFVIFAIIALIAFANF